MAPLLKVQGLSCKTPTTSNSEMKAAVLSFFAIVLLFFNGMAQNQVQIGLLPALNITKKLPRDWSIHAKAESRQKIYHEASAFEYLLTDLSLIAARKVSLNTTIGAGYQLRSEPGSISHRAIQQISLVRRYSGMRLSHRLAADQTFETAEDSEFRFRYRASADFPLQGQAIDPGEFYLKANNEYLYSWTVSDQDLEIRLASYSGYAVGSNGKIELGIEYRVDSFLDNNTRNRIWIAINFFHSI